MRTCVVFHLHPCVCVHWRQTQAPIWTGLFWCVYNPSTDYNLGLLHEVIILLCPVAVFQSWSEISYWQHKWLLVTHIVLWYYGRETGLTLLHFYNQSLLMVFLFGNMLTSARRNAESALSGSSSSCCDMWRWHQLLSDITYLRSLIVLRHFSPQRNLGPSAEITSVSNTSGSVCSSFMCLLVTFFQFSSAEHLNLCQMSLELWANWHFRSNHKSWTPTWPTIVVFKPFLWSIDFLFRVIVLLENKSSPKLQFFCRLQQEVFFFSPPAFLLWFWFLYLSALWGLLHSDVSLEKHSQHQGLESGCAVFRLQLHAQ